MSDIEHFKSLQMEDSPNAKGKVKKRQSSKPSSSQKNNKNLSNPASQTRAKTKENNSKGLHDHKENQSTDILNSSSVTDQTNMSSELTAPENLYDELRGENGNNQNSQIINESLTENANTDKDKKENATTNNEMENGACTVAEAAVQTDNLDLKELVLRINEMEKCCKKMDNSLYDPKNGVEVLLAKNIDKTNTLSSDINSPVAGLKTQIAQLQKEQIEMENKLRSLEKSNARLTQMLGCIRKVSKDISVMQGILQKYSQKHQSAEHKLMDLTKRSMEQNLVLHAIEDPQDIAADEPQNSICKRAVINFCKDLLQVDLSESEIWKAHRMGPHHTDRVRPLVIKVTYRAKELIMENMSKLKNKKNSKNQSYFISEQIPEGIAETKKQTANRLKHLRNENDKKTSDKKQDIRVINDKIIIDGELDKPEVVPPIPMDLFLTVEEQKQVDIMGEQIKQTEPTTVRHSEFVGLAVKVRSTSEVNLAYKAIAQKFSAMDHIMMAYGLREDEKIKFGHCDDGEFAGGSKIRKVMGELKIRNAAIFVVRQYGGIQLGFRRFQVIEDVAKEACSLLMDADKID